MENKVRAMAAAVTEIVSDPFLKSPLILLAADLAADSVAAKPYLAAASTFGASLLT